MSASPCSHQLAALVRVRSPKCFVSRCARRRRATPSGCHGPSRPTARGWLITNLGRRRAWISGRCPFTLRLKGSRRVLRRYFCRPALSKYVRPFRLTAAGVCTDRTSRVRGKCTCGRFPTTERQFRFRILVAAFHSFRHWKKVVLPDRWPADHGSYVLCRAWGIHR